MNLYFQCGRFILCTPAMFQVKLAEHLLVREYVYWNQVRINGSLFLSITTLLRCVMVGMLAQFLWQACLNRHRNYAVKITVWNFQRFPWQVHDFKIWRSVSQLGHDVESLVLKMDINQVILFCLLLTLLMDKWVCCFLGSEKEVSFCMPYYFDVLP